MGSLRRLKEVRERATLTQAELAEKAGVSRDAVVRLENGRRSARPGTARKLAAALGVEPHVLRGDETAAEATKPVSS